MSDLMRKEFEVWAESRGMDLYCSRKNIYVESETLWAWSSWKASRECLVIELPKEDLNIDYSGYVSLSEVEESLAAAGVQYK